MDVARIGLAHGGLDRHLATYHAVRDAAADLGRTVGILVDLPGPKIRCAPFDENGVILENGSRLRVQAGTDASTKDTIEVDHEAVIRDVVVGDRLALGDGGLVLECSDKDSDHLVATVLHGGVAKGRPGFQVPSGRMSLSSPTREDLTYVDAFVSEGVDMIAVSFVRSASDIRSVGVEAPPRGPLLVAKVETQAAVENLEGIVHTSGAVMVARGDLGLDYGLSELPHLQKDIIRRCVASGRPVITATQMLESMVHSPMPTRAEASDVANAVFDGSSAVMLSGESAVGINPVKAVTTMAEIATRADEAFDHGRWASLMRATHDEDAVTDPSVVSTNALTESAREIALQTGARAIICVTRSGFTARKVARFRPEVPILTFTPNERVVRSLALTWGTVPVLAPDRPTADEAVDDALALSKARHGLHPGDQVVVISGRSTKTHQTDTIPIGACPLTGRLRPYLTVSPQLARTVRRRETR